MNLLGLILLLHLLLKLSTSTGTWLFYWELIFTNQTFQELESIRKIDNVNANSKAAADDNDRIKISTEASSDGSNELCLNSTGITVAIALFVVLQLVIGIVWYHLWQRKKKTCREKEEILKKVFNPYAVRN